MRILLWAVFFVLAFATAEFGSSYVAGIIHPPVVDEKPALRVIKSLPKGSDEATETSLLLRNGTYSFAALIFILALLSSLLKRGVFTIEEPMVEEATGSDPLEASSISDKPSGGISSAGKADHGGVVIHLSETKPILLRGNIPSASETQRINRITARARRAMKEAESLSNEKDGTQATTSSDDAIKFIDNGRFELEEALASGGSGVVYKAWDTQLKRHVAIKQLFKSLEAQGSYVQRFFEEAQSLAALTHPNIVPVYDLLVVDDHYWFVMEFLSGGSLANKLDEIGFIDHPEAVDIAICVAQGIAAAHEKGFIHRDIKPHNILFSDNAQVKVTDFGIAKSSRSTVQTTIGLTLGSPAYLSPEQASGCVADIRSDVYSLGVTLYQVLTGEPPFNGDAREVLGKHLAQIPEPPIDLNPEIGTGLSSVVMKALEKDADKRFQNMDQFIAALQATKLG